MERLRSRKAAVEQSIDRQRAASRFEIAPDAQEVSLAVLDEESATATDRPRAADPQAELAPQSEEDDYTARLLEAKRKARKNMEGNQEP
jgi:hypothetical protein